MALYLRSLGIEDGAEQARDGRSCPAEHISVAMTPDKILKGRNANKPIKKDEGCISWYILHLFRYWFTKSTPGSAGGQKEAYGEGKSRQEKVSELE